MKNLANQERRAKYLANDLADTFTSDKFKNRAMYELKCWKNKFKSQFMDLRKEQVAVDECAEKLQEKLTKLNLRMRGNYFEVLFWRANESNKGNGESEWDSCGFGLQERDQNS